MTLRIAALLMRAAALWFVLETLGLADASLAAQRAGDAAAAVARLTEALFSVALAVALVAVAGGVSLFVGRPSWRRR